MRPSDIVPTNLTRETGQIAILAAGRAQSWLVSWGKLERTTLDPGWMKSVADEQDFLANVMSSSWGNTGAVKYAAALWVVEGWGFTTIRRLRMRTPRGYTRYRGRKLSSAKMDTLQQKSYESLVRPVAY